MTDGKYSKLGYQVQIINIEEKKNGYNLFWSRFQMMKHYNGDLLSKHGPQFFRFRHYWRFQPRLLKSRITAYYGQQGHEGRGALWENHPLAYLGSVIYTLSDLDQLLYLSHINSFTNVKKFLRILEGDTNTALNYDAGCIERPP